MELLSETFVVLPQGLILLGELSLVLEQQRCRHTGDNESADDTQFEFSHSHNFENGYGGASAAGGASQSCSGDVHRQTGRSSGDGLMSKNGCQRRGGGGDSFSSQQPTEFLQRAANAPS